MQLDLWDNTGSQTLWFLQVQSSLNMLHSPWDHVNDKTFFSCCISGCFQSVCKLYGPESAVRNKCNKSALSWSYCNFWFGVLDDLETEYTVWNKERPVLSIRNWLESKMGFYIAVYSYIQINGNGNVYKSCLEAEKVFFSLLPVHFINKFNRVSCNFSLS